MLVKMLVSQAGADFVRNPGDIVDVPEAEALRYVASGIAAPVARHTPAETADRPRPRAERAVK